MEIIKKGILLAMDEFRKEFGKDAKLEVGDIFATVFNDAVLIVEVENEKLSFNFLAGKPYRIDYSLDLLSQEKPL